MMTATKEKIKCNCGLGNHIFCPRCSKIRMTILLKNGNDHLKYSRANGVKSNPVWYSHLKYNSMAFDKIAEKMEIRLSKNTELAGAAQVLLFYKNGDRNNHIKKVLL